MTISSDGKKCPRCLKVLQLSAFAKDMRTRSMRAVYCRICDRERHREAGGRQWTPGKKRYDNDPVKRKARQAVRDAVRAGKLTKPATCEACHRNTERRFLYGHHHQGYGKPLVVQWLCAQCHGLAHIQEV